MVGWVVEAEGEAAPFEMADEQWETILTEDDGARRECAADGLTRGARAGDLGQQARVTHFEQDRAAHGHAIEIVGPLA